MTINNTLKYMTIVLFIFSLLNLVIVNAGLMEMKGDGRIVNFSGIARGASQRLVKLEMSGKNSDELIAKLDTIISGLRSGDKKLELPKADDEIYLTTMNSVAAEWSKLKETIYGYRTDKTLQNRLIERSEIFFELANKAVFDAENYSSGNIFRMRLLQGVLFIVNLLLLAGIVYTGRMNITLPLSVIIKRAKNLTSGDGDLSTRVNIRVNNELSDLTGYFNQFIGSIQDVIRVVKEISESLASASGEMSASTMNFSESSQSNAATAEEVSASMEEISASMDSIAHGAEQQLDALQGMMSEEERLSGIIVEAGSIIENTNRIVDTISSRARTGENSLRSMNDIMQNIKKSSVEMGGIISIINDISDQVNLLSLNAAIESARAGDAGRGFAVVADEISKLADRTASSIRDIVSLIGINEKETEKGISGIQVTSRVLGEIISGVGDIGQMFGRVSENMNRQLAVNNAVNVKMESVREKSELIAHATGEQKLAAGEVVHSIGIISDIAQTTATGSEELASTSEEIAGMAESLRSRTDFFKV